MQIIRFIIGLFSKRQRVINNTINKAEKDIFHAELFIDFYNNSKENAPETITPEEMGKVDLKIKNLEDTISFNQSFINFIKAQ